MGVCLATTITLTTSSSLAEETTSKNTAKNSEYTENVAAMTKGSAPVNRKLARAYTTEEKIGWQPLISNYEAMHLRITGPGIEPFETSFKPGERMSFGFYDEESTIWADGVYHWELTAQPRVDEKTKELMTAARNETSVANFGDVLRNSGVVPQGQDMTQTGTFRIFDSQIVHLERELQRRRRERAQARAEAQGFAPDRDPQPNGVQLRDIVHNDDVISSFSHCIGNDCVNGENFGFDTLRLKENNLRIHFEDTSVAASFPPNDWRIVINDSNNGGASYFAIEDASAGRQVFRVAAGARSNALFVDSQGDVGIGTSTPATEIDIKIGDTPTVRLQQDGTSGWNPQTWDLAGNETNFFVRDVSNGSTLPFRVRPGAPTNSIDIKNTGNIGAGTASPDASLHVRRTNGTASVHVEEATATADTRTLLHLENSGPVQMQMEDTDGGGVWDLLVTSDNSFQIDNPNETGTQFLIEEDGTVTASGAIMGGPSDRNVKENVTDISSAEILAKVAELPIREWTYINDETDSRHVGPMAQDFKAAFGLGKTDKYIGALDASGVALAAIQGLHDEVQKKDAELETLRAETSELRSKTAELEAQLRLLVESIGAGKHTD